MADSLIQCEPDNWLCLGYSIMYRRTPFIKKKKKSPRNWVEPSPSPLTITKQIEKLDKELII